MPPLPPPWPISAGKGQFQDPEASQTQPPTPGWVLCPSLPANQPGSLPGAGEPGQPLWFTAKGRHSHPWPAVPSAALPALRFSSPAPRGEDRGEEWTPGPRDSGLLGTREPKDSAGFRGAPRPHACIPGAPSLGCLPPRSWALMPSTLSGLLFVSSHPPFLPGGGDAPVSLETQPQPKGRGHAAQPGKAVTHSIRPSFSPARFPMSHMSGRCPRGLAVGHGGRGRRAHGRWIRTALARPGLAPGGP